MARMQSRLSQASSHRRNRLLPLSSPLKPISGSVSNPFGISRIRERAGSVFSPKKRRDTTATKTSAVSAEDAADASAAGSTSRRGTGPGAVPAVDSRTGEPTVAIERRGTGGSEIPDVNADLEGGDTFGHGFGIGKTGMPPRGGPTV